ncbi:cobalamin synthesis protein P47K [Ahrensia sp. R2A130]|nr:cobalamin synthesis protein P47K [Ahrensia sp. R2A130]
MNAIPVSVLTGFLGSGKTTLLNRLIKSGGLSDTAFIINEFGDVGIDHLLVEQSDEGIVELSDGCLCCTIRSDLVDTLTRLLNRDGGAPARIVIETTGLADPAPVLHALMAHPVLSDRLRLDGVITTVDAVNGSATLDAHEEAVKQVAMADRLVVTKTDLTKAEDVTGRLRALNPSARIVMPDAGFAELFDCGLYNPATKTADVSRWLGEEAAKDGHHHHHHDVNRHDARIRAFTLATDDAVDSVTLAGFLDLLQAAHGPNLLRVKGIVRLKEDPDRPVVIHGVQQVFHPPAQLPAWPDDDHRTRLVMITRDLEPDFVQRLFDAFTGKPQIDMPDRAAMMDNPLAVPGVKL